MKPVAKNSFRPFHYDGTQDRELFCDRVSLARLVREYGTPLYVYSANNILDRVQMFADAFADMRATLCYSVKANSNLSILRLLASAGTGFDIVSGGELERVRQAAKPCLHRVVFSGVGKTAAEIDAALAAQILVFNVESPAELDLLEQRARHLRKRAPVAMRVNPDVFAATHPYISTGMTAHKFGVAIGDATALYLRAARSPYLVSTGVSVHIGSQIRATEPFGQALQRVSELARELKSSHGIRIQHIDAGGGLGISYDDPQPTGKAGKMFHYSTRRLPCWDMRSISAPRSPVLMASCCWSRGGSSSPRQARCWPRCCTPSATVPKHLSSPTPP